MNKPHPPRLQTSARRRTAGRARIVHTQLDPDMPYARVTAPPSYGDTLRADSRMQQQQASETQQASEMQQDETEQDEMQEERRVAATGDEESHLILEDVLANSDSSV